MSTFGKLTAGSTSATSSVDKEFVSTATCGASETVDKGSAHVWLSAGGSTSAVFVIYADSSGAPGSLLATSDQVTVNWTADTLTDFPFTGANRISVTNGTPYWIGVAWQDPGAINFTVGRDNTASGRDEQILTWPTIPNPFGTPSAVNTGPIAAFVTTVVSYTPLFVPLSQPVPMRPIVGMY